MSKEAYWPSLKKGQMAWKIGEMAITVRGNPIINCTEKPEANEIE